MRDILSLTYIFYLRSLKPCLFLQNDVINVGNELGSGDAGYFSTSPQMAYQPATTTTTATQQLTPQTPNTPTIILTGISAKMCDKMFNYISR